MAFYDWKLSGMFFSAKPSVGMTGVCVYMYVRENVLYLSQNNIWVVQIYF